MTNQNNDGYVIPKALLHDIRAYLGTRPHDEVCNAIRQIEVCINVQEKIKNPQKTG